MVDRNASDQVHPATTPALDAVGAQNGEPSAGGNGGSEKGAGATATAGPAGAAAPTQAAPAPDELRLREIAERHANADTNDGALTVDVILGALKELHQVRLVEAERLLKTARDHLETANEIILSEGGDEQDHADERGFIAEIDAYFAPAPATDEPRTKP